MKYLLMIIVLAAPAAAAEPQGDFIKKQKGFIISLFMQERHFDCIAETERLMHYDSAGRENYRYFLEANYFLWGQYRSVILRISGKEQDEVRYRLLLANSFLRLGMPRQALDAVQGFRYGDTDERYRWDIFISRSHACIGTGKYDILNKELESADEFFRGMRQFARIRENVAAINSLGLKSEPLAAVLSALVPGSGQVYSGKYPEGVLSFAAVGLAGYGSWYFISRRQAGLAGTMLFFTALFYAGNIYGGYNSARAYNDGALSGSRRGLEDLLVPEYRPLNESDIRGLRE